LLFEWKPRSFVPVALASATAAALRPWILGPGPLFPVPEHASFVGASGLIGCLAVGLAAGVVSTLLTRSVYLAEDLFQRLRVHWMWWPALGGIAIGLGGLIEPHALGVGYDQIGVLLGGSVTAGDASRLMIVKWIIWAVALGSGTSGGVVAPLLLIGGALGGLEARVLPDEGAGFWTLISMGAVLGGTMRSPFTGVVFLVELTNDYRAFLPLLVAVTIAHATTVLVLKRSILTEKVARRGYHVTREYEIDPLEVLFVREVMLTSFVTLDSSMRADEALERIDRDERARAQRLYPVVDEQGLLCGIVTASRLRRVTRQAQVGPAPRLAEMIGATPVVAHPDESLRSVVYRMASSGRTRLIVVEREEPRRIVGLVWLRHLLKARARHFEEERGLDGVLRLPFSSPGVKVMRSGEGE